MTPVKLITKVSDPAIKKHARARLEDVATKNGISYAKLVYLAGKDINYCTYIELRQLEDKIRREGWRLR